MRLALLWVGVNMERKLAGSGLWSGGGYFFSINYLEAGE